MWDLKPLVVNNKPFMVVFKAYTCKKGLQRGMADRLA
jgi:hypothetical protein